MLHVAHVADEHTIIIPTNSGLVQPVEAIARVFTAYKLAYADQTVRASPHYYNTMEEVAALLMAVEEITQ